MIMITVLMIIFYLPKVVSIVCKFSGSRLISLYGRSQGSGVRQIWDRSIPWRISRRQVTDVGQFPQSLTGFIEDDVGLDLDLGFHALVAVPLTGGGARGLTDIICNFSEMPSLGSLCPSRRNSPSVFGTSSPSSKIVTSYQE